MKTLDQTSIHSDYSSDNLQPSPNRNNDPQNSNGITSPPPFYTKRPTRKLPIMSKLNILPKRKSYKTITIDNSKQVTQSMTHPSLPVIQKSLPNLPTLKRKLLSRFIQKRIIRFHHLSNIGHSELSSHDTSWLPL